MKTVAIMQPYLFPYLGYFQLIQASDTFLLYDDVQFIKGGWVNRNYLLMNGAPSLFTFGLAKASTFAPICERQLSAHFSKERKQFFKTLKTAYNKAPYYEPVCTLMHSILHEAETHNLSQFITHSIQRILNYIGLNREILRSSELSEARNLHGEDRVITLCQHLKAQRYVNAIGGQALYSKEHFQQQGLELCFLKSSEVSYAQYKPPFVPNLSIVDVLMFNAPSEVQERLHAYELV